MHRPAALTFGGGQSTHEEMHRACQRSPAIRRAGIVRSGVEACDDGNASNGDACLNTCVAATCGDG